MNEYIVYIGKVENKIMYIGEGKPGRQLHLLSGTSHVYEANRAHFTGKLIEVEILCSGLTKEDAVYTEKRLIEELCPEWNKETIKIGKLETKKMNLEGARRAIKKEKIKLINQQEFLFYVVRRMNRLSTCVVTAQDIRRDFKDKFSEGFLSNLCKGRAYDKLLRILKVEYISLGEYKFTWVYDK